MALGTGTVVKSLGEQKVVSNDPRNAYVANGDYHGNSRTTSSGGISEFTPNNYSLVTIMDRFVSVGGDDNIYVKGNKEDRVDDGNLTVVVGPSISLQTDAYNRWAAEYAKIAAANLLPDVKVEAYPILPGVDYNNLG